MTKIDWIEETEKGFRTRIESTIIRFDDMSISIVASGSVAIAFYKDEEQIAMVLGRF